MRILSGMRSTGRLHVGHYLGALKNWVHLQDEGHDCFFMVADWHALTSDYADASRLRENMKESVLGWLSAGLDPSKSTIFVQSLVKEHAELALLLGMFTPLPWLERNPSYKDQITQLSNKDLETYGFLGYPVLQAADILAYQAEAVPVGEDQVPHLELTREIARRVNFFYGGPIEPVTNRPTRPIFTEPEPILSHVPKLSGLDGRKMSKSYDNGIHLDEPADSVLAKVKTMITDTNRVRRSDPGNPDNCNVYSYQKIFNASAVEEIDSGCRGASLGCVDCKKMLAGAINGMLEPMRELRAHYEQKPAEVTEILDHGTKKARAEVCKTMEVLRDRMDLVETVADLEKVMHPSPAVE